MHPLDSDKPTMNDLTNWLPKDGEWHHIGYGTTAKHCGTFTWNDNWP